MASIDNKTIALLNYSPSFQGKLNIPKKTKLFVDQTARERENSLLMHRVFQHDLYLMRLNTARAFVSTLESSSNPVTLDHAEPLKLSAQVRNVVLLSRTSEFVWTTRLSK